jgi:hypothetical protein
MLYNGTMLIYNASAQLTACLVTWRVISKQNLLRQNSYCVNSVDEDLIKVGVFLV